jgi:hypothetical protein
MHSPPSLYGTNSLLEDTFTNTLTSLPHQLSPLYPDTLRHVNLMCSSSLSAFNFIQHAYIQNAFDLGFVEYGFFPL